MKKFAGYVSASILAVVMLGLSASVSGAVSYQEIINYMANNNSGETEVVVEQKPQNPKPQETKPQNTKQQQDHVSNLTVISADKYMSNLKNLRDAQPGQNEKSAKQENDGKNYNRDEYKHWAKITNPQDWGPRAGTLITKKCTSKNASLIRQSHEGIKVDANCKIAEGAVLTEAYGVIDGKDVSYPEFVSNEKGNFPNVDSDHVVALKSIEKSGGYKMDAKTKKEIANDPLNLISTSAKENRSKSDKTADQYLPADPGMRCIYVSTYVETKSKYDLSVSGTERKALEDAGKACGF